MFKLAFLVLLRLYVMSARILGNESSILVGRMWIWNFSSSVQFDTSGVSAACG